MLLNELKQNDLKNGYYGSSKNPSESLVSKTVKTFMNDVDYTFTIFTGHGFINSDDNNRQYIEVADNDIPISNLRTNAKRQTLIVDACRGYHSPSEPTIKIFSKSFESFTGDYFNTREIFNKAVMRAEEGWTILYAASCNQTALDTDNGAAYLLSLLKMAKNWESMDKKSNVIHLNLIHEGAKKYLSKTFDTIQVPVMNKEKRLNHFPFAVKVTLLHG